jgi:hypothetical protein
MCAQYLYFLFVPSRIRWYSFLWAAMGLPFCMPIIETFPGCHTRTLVRAGSGAADWLMWSTGGSWMDLGDTEIPPDFNC